MRYQTDGQQQSEQTRSGVGRECGRHGMEFGSVLVCGVALVQRRTSVASLVVASRGQGYY